MYLDFEEDSDLKKQMKYLVENETDGNGALIEDIEQLTLIDPACGSGHILVTGFEWLYKMYREQGYTAKNAIESILKHNLFGLDIDDRAMQLARFAVLLKAAQQLQQVDASQAIALMNNPLDVIPHIYAFPEKSFFTTEDVALFTNNQHVAEIHTVFESLREGKNIGSALKIILSDAAREVLITQYEDWNAKAKLGTLDFEQQAVFSTLKNYIEVALVLSKRYAAVVANPPYMGQKSMNAQLKTYLDRNYPNSKSDLFAVFMEKMMDMVQDNARIGCITMESWMFLSSYEKLRKSIIEKYSIVGLGHFGWHILGIAFGTAMLILEKSKKITIGEYSYLTIDDVDREENVPFVFPKKDNGRFARIPQTNFDKIPGSPIAYWVSERVREIFRNEILSNINKPRQGIATSNNDYFLKLWFEVSFDKIGISKIKDDSNEKWYPYNKGGESRKWYGNDYYVLNYENDGQELKGFSKSVIRNPEFQMLESLTWSLTSSDKFAVRKKEKGYFFDVNGMSLFPSDDQYYLLGLLNSKYAFNILKLLNPTMAFQVGDISRIPVIYQKNQKLSFFSSENVQITKKDWDSRETSWDFDTNPLLGQQQNNLAAAYEAWVAEVSQGYFQLHANEEELNRIFIDIYGLQDELTPEVALKDITILQDELKADDLEAIEPAFRAGEMVTLPIQQNVVMQQLLSYLVGTMLGRYRLDKASLHIAHPNPTEEELAAYQVENVALPFQMEIDEDAIIPLMGSACAFPDDAVKRVDNLLHRIWGDESHTENLNFLNQCLGIDYEKWITEQFWAYHISGTMYKKKPIYWLFCSNPKSPQKSAFRVLVYMHRMDAYTVQKILRNYLHPHIEYVKGQYEEMQQNELNLSKQELKVFDNMAKQISELKVYEQVLKELANQQITFNLDDGVTVNYAKFEGAVAVIK
ncbi:MAG TPA: BREX-1 system adenine-specific DNA-methyltransferase PglX [Flavobacteriaceae bacterium]|nr:BREX-1 system adenine-specific DNA-methyltransferase PglX [Flavobacteriaceae bacterium]